MSNKSKIGVIQARMGSSRFPGKVLHSFLGKPMLQFQIGLLQQFTLFDKLIVATSIEKSDELILKLCEKLDVEVYRGSENNVFSRYKSIAELNKNSTIIRLTGDNPLPNYTLLNGILNFHKEHHSIFSTTRVIENERIIKRTLPKGFSIDVFDSSIFGFIEEGNLSSFDKEHVIPSFYRVCQAKLYYNNKFENRAPTTVDTFEDLKAMEVLTKKLICLSEFNKFLGFEY